VPYLSLSTPLKGPKLEGDEVDWQEGQIPGKTCLIHPKLIHECEQECCNDSRGQHEAPGLFEFGHSHLAVPPMEDKVAHEDAELENSEGAGIAGGGSVDDTGRNNATEKPKWVALAVQMAGKEPGTRSDDGGYYGVHECKRKVIHARSGLVLD
jgi:hypothetical protein